MNERLFRYVKHEDVAEYESMGWIKHSALDGTHHGDHAVLMELIGNAKAQTEEGRN